jgi:hypothetical protein
LLTFVEFTADARTHFAEGKWRRQRWDNLHRFGVSNAPR